ncbi:hypothetical protein C0J52_01535 [Blattella germanica]|nr:hypothetical protein C0J52_01535 [Blattella germanica]
MQKRLADPRKPTSRPEQTEQTRSYAVSAQALRLKFKKVVELWLLEQKRNYLYYFNYKNIIVRT